MDAHGILRIPGDDETLMPIMPFIRWQLNIKLRQAVSLPYGFINRSGGFGTTEIKHYDFLYDVNAMVKNAIRVQTFAQMYQHWWEAMGK